ncbi:hypothetical protein PPSIR1_02788 [Plesiocystis pacifica SIR-1]|uniref:PASTA domain-containing protein n=1 Tax=Plesiocystis pacifica SIR-1 TaxID=391625 RepID=A6G928_9BACT|nr:hypothetical protein [Plesiocystis pacifica]EDM77576.1 hypothetical protein PPSIR1_02788 [Plesiocystis pacifica SIR-1]
MSAPRRSPAHTAIAIAASVASLAAIVFMGLGGLEARAQSEVADDAQDGELAEPETELETKTQTSQASHAKAPAPAPLPAAAPTPTAAANDDATPQADAPAMVRVPDVAGERLWVARKHLREVGLVLAPRDQWNRDRVVPTPDYGAYVVGETEVIGTEVPAGSKVEVPIDYWSPKWGRGY